MGHMGQITLHCLCFFDFHQYEEILSIWNDRNFGGAATRNDLIMELQKNQRDFDCQRLITTLEQTTRGKP